MAQGPNDTSIDPLWYKDAIIYQAHVKSFFDKNNDGVGDFQGLTQKLDYLQSLGITCLWLLPFFPSPLKDDGYDIADYRSIHPAYGTLEDFQALVQDRQLAVLGGLGRPWNESLVFPPPLRLQHGHVCAVRDHAAEYPGMRKARSHRPMTQTRTATSET